MALNQYTSARTRSQSLLATHTVLRNTYMLLSLTLIFSAVMAVFSMNTNAHPNFLVTIGGMFGLMFLTQALRNSAWGLVSIFAFTGFMGYILGPTLNFYIHNFNNGSEIIMTSLGATGLIFLGLSAYVMSTGKDFSYMGGMLFAAITVAFLTGLAAILFNMPMLSLVVSGAFALLACGYILFTTSAIINDGETNYIMATISLYVAIFNLFVSLLQLLGAFAGNRD